MKPTASQSCLFLAALALGTSCAGPRSSAPATPAAPAVNTATTVDATPPAPRASGRPEIRYYEIAAA